MALSRLRELFRAARELYLDCQRERTLAEASLDGETDSGAEPSRKVRADAARRREEAMRNASRLLVHHIHAPDGGQS